MTTQELDCVMNENRMRPATVLIERLARLAWRESHNSWMPTTTSQAEYVRECQRTDDYHGPRVAYFLDQFRSGRDCDPPRCDMGSLTGKIGILDGHHRFVAAVLAQREGLMQTMTIRIAGGVPGIMKWLAGSIDEFPMDGLWFDPFTDRQLIEL